MDDKLKRYADIKQEIKSLTAEADAMKPEITAHMDKEGADKIETSFGIFSFTIRKKWAYPNYVADLEKSFKTKKKESEENGDATFEESKTLTFNEVKPSEEEGK